MINEDYLKDVNIDEKTKNELIEKTSLDISDISDVVKEAIGNYPQDSTPKWVKCVKDCQTLLVWHINNEIKSTAYMLRLLAASIIKVDKNIIMKFNIEEGKNLTGIWSEDSKKIKMSTSEITSKNPRLIMGFGPSASGKTYWTKNLINMLSSADPNFPKIFLSVDGGIAREKSIVYQEILKILNLKEYDHINGFENLVSTEIIGSSLFKSDTIKKSINKYLKGYELSPISLYIPTTASGPRNPYSKYVKMTQDKKWIGVYIYQHKELCDKGVKYKCETTNESGTQREKKEGKKFDTRAYERSEKNGCKFMKRAPGGRIEIHNSGHPDRGSIITEYGIDKKFLLTEELVSSLPKSQDSSPNLYKRVNSGDVSIITTFRVERFGGTRKRRKRKYSGTRKNGNQNRKKLIQ